MKWLGSLFTLVGATLTACSSDGPACVESAPLVAAEAATPQLVRFNEPFRWIDAEYSEVRAAQPVLLGGDPPLATDHAAVRWLQAWADQIDSIVRTQVAQELGVELSAPPPILEIVPSKGTLRNAYAATVPVQLQQPVGEAGTILGVRKIDYPGGAMLYGYPLAQTLARPAAWNDDTALVRYLQDNQQLGNVELANGRLGFACDPTGPDAGVAVYSTSRFVTMTVGMAVQLPEGAALLTLAHELSHYYRAHLTPGLATPTYWFENAEVSTWEPVESKRAEAIDRAYRVALGEADSGADAELVAQAKSNSFAYLTVEMQADRLAAYLLHRLGFDSNAIVAAFGELHGAVETPAMPAPACAELTARGFHDEQGGDVFMPIFPLPLAGELPSGHPALCYRAFDFYRQSRGRSEAVGTRPTLAVGSWDDAKATLQIDPP